MRVPLPFVLLLSLCLVSGIWWHQTRGYDFLSEPSEAKVQRIRKQAQVELEAPHPISPEDLTPPPLAETPPPAVDAGHELAHVSSGGDAAPTIQEYRDVAGKGTAYLIGLAVLLETAKDNQRALLAWERVLDSSTTATHEQQVAAMSSTFRLRQSVPPWPSTAQQRKIVVRADTAPRNAATLQPVLEELCKEMTESTSGILQFNSEIRQTINPKSRKTIPSVTISMIGTLPGAARSESIKFTPPSDAALSAELRRRTYGMLREKFAQIPEVVAPTAWPKEENAIATVFRSRLTRLQWLELGVAMQRPPVVAKIIENPPKKKKTR